MAETEDERKPLLEEGKQEKQDDEDRSLRTCTRCLSKWSPFGWCVRAAKTQESTLFLGHCFEKHPYGCGSKQGTQHGTLLNENQD